MMLKKNARMTVICFFSYFLFGFIDNMKGATLPNLLSDLRFSYSDGGNIVFSEYLGFVLATLAAGAISDAFGKRCGMFMAGIFLLFGIYGYSSSQSIWMSMLSLALVVLVAVQLSWEAAI